MAVYFIQATDGGPIKIGFASDPMKRLAALQTSHNERLVLRRVIKSGTIETERELHGRFAEHRLVGEWFYAAPELASYGRCKAAKSERQQIDETHEHSSRGQDELADSMIRFLRSDGPLKLSELLHLATILNSNLFEVGDDLQEHVVRLRLAFLERYHAFDETRIEEAQRELRHIERKKQ